MNLRRLLVFLLLNALVSVVVTLAVLWMWDRAHPPAEKPAADFLLGEAAYVSPSPMAVPRPTATSMVYSVRSGDTLGAIAVRYGVSVEALLAANGLADPNVLHVGQTLVIPIAGALVPTATTPASLPVETPPVRPPTPTCDPHIPPPRLQIRSILRPGVLAEEVVVIANSGGPVDLVGWSLSDGSGRRYLFPSLTLFQDGVVNVRSAAGVDTVTDLYWHSEQAVWSSGETAYLYDPDGDLHARFVVP